MKIFSLFNFMLVLSLMFFAATSALASINQTKIYREAYPDDEKPKCIHCHVDKKPSKEATKHALNEYGSKVLNLATEPTADTYKAVGKAPEPKE